VSKEFVCKLASVNDAPEEGVEDSDLPESTNSKLSKTTRIALLFSPPWIPTDPVSVFLQ